MARVFCTSARVSFPFPASCQFALSRELTSKLARRLFSESPVRTAVIVFPPPPLDELFRLHDAREPVNVEALRSHVPLNDSMNALSVGLPGREKSIRTPFR